MEKSVIEEIVNLQWNLIQSKLKTWMKSTNFSLETVQEISEIFDQSHHHIYQNQLKVLQNQNYSPRNAAKFTKMCKERVKNELTPIVAEIQFGLTLFLQNAEKHLKISTQQHTNSQLENSLDQILEQVLKQVGENSKELVQFGARKMIEKYRTEQGIGQETSCLQGMQLIRDFHQEYLNQQLSFSEPCDPTILFKRHEKLTSSMLQAFTETFGSVKDLAAKQTQLKERFIHDFFNFHTKTMSKLEYQMKGVNQLIEKLGKNYESQMDVLLKENPAGLEEIRFKSVHKQVLDNCVKELVDAIHQDILKDEPTDAHILALKASIKKVYKVLKTENKNTLEAREEHAKYQNRKENQVATKIQQRIKNGSELMENTSATKSKMILFQLAYHKIGAASITRNGEPEDIQFHPAIVVLTNYDEWLYGEEASNYSGNAKGTWHIEEYWSHRDLVEKILVNGEYVSICVEFLLSIFFTEIIKKMEDETTEEILEALVAVPYWFNSLQRQQILDAAKISGFIRVQLINENSCSAFFMYAGNFHDPLYDTVVISENSQKVDISLYSYNQHITMLFLDGHCGDYEVKEATNQNMGTYKFLSGILNYLSSHVWEVGVEDEALKNFELLWQLALSRAEAKTPGSKNKSRKVLICCESDQCRDLLWRLATKITDPDLISVRSDTVINGLASIYNSTIFNMNSTTRYVIVDSTPFRTEFFSPKGDLISAIKDEDSKPLYYLEPTRQKFQIQKESEGQTIFRIQQVNSGMDNQVATFTLNGLPNTFTSVTVTLLRSLSGVLMLYKVECSKESLYEPYTTTLSNNYYTWESFGLHENDKIALKSVIGRIKLHKQGTLKQIVNGLEETLLLGEKIKKAVNRGMCTFKSSSGKENLLEVIDSSLQMLRQHTVSEYFVQQHKELFNEMSKTYKIKL